MMGFENPSRRSVWSTWEAVRAGQHDVEHDEVRRLGARQREAPLTVLGGEDRVALALEVHPQAHHDARVVLDHEDRARARVARAIHAHAREPSACGSAAWSPFVGGRTMRNVDPRPSMLSS